jgi:hypothetical protein
MHQPLRPSNHRNTERHCQQCVNDVRREHRRNERLKFQLHEIDKKSVEPVQKNEDPQPSDENSKELFLVHFNPPPSPRIGRNCVVCIARIAFLITARIWSGTSQ